jgi:hypothetical protein
VVHGLHGAEDAILAGEGDALLELPDPALIRRLPRGLDDVAPLPVASRCQPEDAQAVGVGLDDCIVLDGRVVELPGGGIRTLK